MQPCESQKHGVFALRRKVENLVPSLQTDLASPTTVSVIVPIRNEEKYIGKCLESLLSQSYPAELYEVIVADGRSSDRSLEIVKRIACDHPNLRLVDNPGATAPAGMNIGIRGAKGDIIIRADGHNFYPNNYVKNCVKYLNETGADNVGGPWHTVPAENTFGARLVAAVLTSPFGVGNSQFRISAKEGFVETVPFGAFRRELFDRVGMYNEKLVRNQDNDLNARIRAKGGKIFQTPALTTEYHPVAKFPDLLRLTFRQSQWHVFSVRENAGSMSIRHFVPALFLATIAAMVVLSFFSSVIAAALIGLTALYFAIGYWFAIVKSKNYALRTVCVLPLACACYHVSYGAGTLAGFKYLLRPPSRQPIREGQNIDQSRSEGPAAATQFVQNSES